MAITDLIPIPDGINPGLSAAGQRTMLSILGNPRSSYNQTCQPVTNPSLRALIVTATVGPLRVTGLSPAIDSLKQVMADVQQSEPEIFDALGTEGMLCARLVRGSTTSISNHSWGTAIDLTLDGQLDTRGDDLVQQGLATIAPIFNRHGWFWGAGFHTEDGMHFEISDQKIRELQSTGVVGSPTALPPNAALSLGDRGPEVKKLQESLNAAGADLVADGAFGRNTQAAVMAFQASKGLTVDGIAGPDTLAALGLA